MLVVDASAVLYAAASANGLASLDPLEPVSPPLMWSEALSALRETAWRKPVSVDLAEATRDRVLAAPIRRMIPDGLYEEAWRVSRALGWAKTYDAEYVALARLLSCRLLTVDRRLQRGASRLVHVIGPMEL